MSEQASAEVSVRKRSYSSSSGSDVGGDTRKMRSAVIEARYQDLRHGHWCDGVVVSGPPRHTQAPPTDPLS